MAARNMYRIEINIQEKLSIQLVIYKDHTRMHGQQNIELCVDCLSGKLETQALTFEGKVHCCLITALSLRT